METISTSLQVRNAKVGVYRISGATGLYFKKTSAEPGSGCYFVRYRFGGRRPTMGLGALASISLAEARKRAIAARAKARDKGIDPLEARRLEPPSRVRKALTRIEAPNLVHLYRHYGFDGKLLYVGVAKNTLRRWNDHGGVAEWADLVATITVDHYPTRGEAEAAENAAILAEKPRFNSRVHLRPRKPKS